MTYLKPSLRVPPSENPVRPPPLKLPTPQPPSVAAEPKPAERREPMSHPVVFEAAFDAAALRRGNFAILPLRGSLSVTGVAPGDPVPSLLLRAAGKTVKVASGALNAAFCGTLIVGTAALDDARTKPPAHHHHERKAKEPTIGEALDKLVRSLDPLAPSK